VDEPPRDSARGSKGNAGSSSDHEVDDAVDWAAFLERHDLLWDRLPERWFEGPFLGNGQMGTMVYKPSRQPLRFDVQRSDVQDHRDNSQGWSAYSRARLPIGHFRLETVGRVRGGSLRLDLHNAEARGSLETEQGTIEWRALVPTGNMALIVETNATPGERDFRWTFVPERAISPRQNWDGSYTLEHRHKIAYQDNPPPGLATKIDGGACEQPLRVGGGHATVWRELRPSSGRRLLYASVAPSYPESDYRARADRLLETAVSTPFADGVRVHRKWWHDYYPESFVSLPDTRLEAFYWIQMYKLASATRADQALIDNHGPWLEPTKWPYATWNLNVQLTYWPCYPSGRLHLGESLCRALDDNIDALINNVPEPYRHDSAGIGRSATLDMIAEVGIPGQKDVGQYGVPEVGLLPWACHNYYLQYRYSMDRALLRDRLFPLMRRAFNYYLHFLERGEDGKLHLPPTYCPEFGVAPDNNFDLGLMRWGYATLLATCEDLRIDDPLIPRWKEVLRDLTPFAVDKNGLMVGAGVPWDKSHRHYSHLLAFYPLRVLDPRQADHRELIVRTLEHWLTIGGSSHHRGYSFTGAASMFATLGDGDRALGFLNQLLDSESRSFGGKWVRPNTMYLESGPVIETPLSAAQSLHDMLLQSWGGTLRVFPALPTAWKDVVIRDLRAEGAFEVTAVRRNGRTHFVRIRSLAGEPCRVVPGIEGVVRVLGGGRVLRSDDGAIELKLERGAEVILVGADFAPSLRVAPLAPEKGKRNYFGVRY